MVFAINFCFFGERDGSLTILFFYVIFRGWHIGARLGCELKVRGGAALSKLLAGWDTSVIFEEIISENFCDIWDNGIYDSSNDAG